MRFVLAAVLLLGSAAPAFAGTDVPLAPFKGIELHGGGEVVLKHGAVQRVTLISGSTQYTTFTVKQGSLEISACSNWFTCPHRYDLRIEIVTPLVTAIDVHGGGELRSEGGFPHLDELSVEVHGGGDVDLRSMPAATVNAEVHGGGALKTTAERGLNAEVSGGGEIVYWGNPAQLAVSTHGGGSVQRGS